MHSQGENAKVTESQALGKSPGDSQSPTCPGAMLMLKEKGKDRRNEDSLRFSGVGQLTGQIQITTTRAPAMRRKELNTVSISLKQYNHPHNGMVPLLRGEN